MSATLLTVMPNSYYCNLSQYFANITSYYLVYHVFCAKIYIQYWYANEQIPQLKPCHILLWNYYLCLYFQLLIPCVQFMFGIYCKDMEGQYIKVSHIILSICGYMYIPVVHHSKPIQAFFSFIKLLHNFGAGTFTINYLNFTANAIDRFCPFISLQHSYGRPRTFPINASILLLVFHWKYNSGPIFVELIPF